jgi:hypothetical protein
MQLRARERTMRPPSPTPPQLPQFSQEEYNQYLAFAERRLAGITYRARRGKEGIHYLCDHEELVATVLERACRRFDPKHAKDAEHAKAIFRAYVYRNIEGEAKKLRKKWYLDKDRRLEVVEERPSDENGVMSQRSWIVRTPTLEAQLMALESGRDPHAAETEEECCQAMLPSVDRYLDSLRKSDRCRPWTA